MSNFHEKWDVSKTQKHIDRVKLEKKIILMSGKEKKECEDPKANENFKKALKNISKYDLNSIKSSGPTLTLKDLEESFEESKVLFSSSSLSCNLCNESDIKGTELCYTEECFSDLNNLTSACCYSLMCPNCVKIESKTVTYHYLFIKSIIYLQEDEEEPDSNKIDPCSSIQYNWVVYPRYDKFVLDKYKKVDKEYNGYGTDMSFEGEDICCSCICKNCGFECSARIYMDS